MVGRGKFVTLLRSRLVRIAEKKDEAVQRAKDAGIDIHPES
jgi:hypothetical protein